MLTPHVAVRINLSRIRENARQVRAMTRVDIIAVVKADAYGLGADRVVEALHDLVDGFCVFSLSEAVAARIWERTKLGCLALGPNPGVTAEQFRHDHVQPSVWDIERAVTLRTARPILCVDTGMQRFACPRENLDSVLQAGGCEEAFTHAITLDHVMQLLQLLDGRGLRLHSAGSSLLHEPAARLNAVRPGLALYRGAARVTTQLIDERKSTGPVGYTGFSASRHGVILAGYSNGLRPGPCFINGRRSRILEVGMQSSFIETIESDRVRDEVVLLGDDITESELAMEWKCSSQEVLTRLCTGGMREYAG